MRDGLYYKMLDYRLKTAGNSTPGQDKLLDYLFLCLAYELKQDKDKIIYQEPVWSDPETTFSIVMYRSGVTHECCCLCIETLGGSWQRECGPVTTAYSKSQEECDELKSRFISLLDNAQERLAGLNDKNPQEYFFLKTNPKIIRIEETPNNHFVFLKADIVDELDRHVCEAVLGNCEISVIPDDEPSEIKLVCDRKKWRDQLVRYLKNLGLED